MRRKMPDDRRRGQSLVEVLIAIAVGAVLLAGGATMIAPALKENSQATRVRAMSSLGNELMSNVRSWAGNNWNALLSVGTTSANLYYLDTSQSPFMPVATSSGQSVTYGGMQYLRYFYVTDVYRDGSGNATTATSGNAYDPSTKEITVVIVASSTPVTSSTFTAYLTRSANNTFSQSDWSGGGGNNSPATVASNTYSTSTNLDTLVAGQITLAQSLSACVSSIVSSTDLTLYWPFDEGYGITAYDDSGYGNYGEWYGPWSSPNSTHYTTGKVGPYSGYFDGIDNVVATPNQTSGPSVYSISLWFKTTTGNGGLLVGFGDSNDASLSGSHDRQIYMTDSGQIDFGNYTGSVQIVTSSASYNDGSWHNVIGTLSSAGQYLYVDGSLVSSSTNTGAQSFSGSWRIGLDNLYGWPNQPSNFYFAGEIDDVRIYNRALTASEASTIYGGGVVP